MRTKRDFEVKEKGFFIILKGFSAAKNYLKSESAPLALSFLGMLTHGEGAKMPLLPKIRHTYPIVMKFALAKEDLKNI